jgi:hypothetical protein
MVVDGPEIVDHSNGDCYKDRWRTEALDHIRCSVKFTKLPAPTDWMSRAISDKVELVDFVPRDSMGIWQDTRCLEEVCRGWRLGNAASVSPGATQLVKQRCPE